MKLPYLSVVIPIYNEARRLKNLAAVHQFLQRQSYTSELIVVNDGSTDKSIKNIAVPATIISYSKNRGKGYAIKKGMLKSRGDYVLFMDVDLSVPLPTINAFLKKPSDVLIATRKIKSARVLKHQPLLRETLGKVFTLLSQYVTGVKVSDFTCGFKMFSRRAAHSIFTKSTINRWSFDAEILYLAKKAGYTINEIPVVWKNDPATKVKFPQDIIHSLKELWYIKSHLQ